jgi:hypothetical protein
MQNTEKPWQEPADYSMILGLFITITFIVTFYQNGCVDSHFTPPVDTTRAGSRNYTWKVDTIPAVGLLAVSVWGSSPNDVWVVGPAGASRESKWHYDGVKWKVDSSSTGNMISVFGFSKNDVWMGSSSDGKIFHFDGYSWVLSAQFSVPGYTWLSWSSICGLNPGNVFAVGYALNRNMQQLGTVAHYDGKVWKLLEIDSIACEFSKIVNDNRIEKYFILADKIVVDSNNITSDTTLSYQYDGGSHLKRLVYPIQDNNIVQIDGLALFTGTDGKMSHYEDSSFALWKEIPGEDLSGVLGGRSAKDIIIQEVVASHVVIRQYNGSTTQTIYDVPGDFGLVSGAMILPQDIFLSFWGGGGIFPVIVHGVISPDSLTRNYIAKEK